MKRTVVMGLIAVALCAFVAPSWADGIGLKRDLTYKAGDGFVEALKDSIPIARYVYKDTPKPYIYPLSTPDGPAVTRAFPMKQVPGESTDHPNQRSFWVAYGNVNGVDFWAEEAKSGKIVQTNLEFDSLNPGYWNIHASLDWVGPDGKKILEEDRRYSFLSCDYGLLVSTAIALLPPVKEVKFGGTKEGFLAFRVADGISLAAGKGHILNSEGQTNAACLGKRARWCDYTGVVDGKTCGITIFDMPSNHGYPTYWHVRDYGLLAANPFGGRDFTGDEKADSSLTIQPGKPVRLIYVALIHNGKIEPDKLDLIADQVVGKAAPKKSPAAGPKSPGTSP